MSPFQREPSTTGIDITILPDKIFLLCLNYQIFKEVRMMSPDLKILESVAEYSSGNQDEPFS